jgi:hypothetical protein
VSYDVDATVRIRNDAGSLVLDLSTGGYWVGPVDDNGYSWRRIRATSPFIDGSALVQATRDIGTLEFAVRVEGVTWVEVQQRFEALLASVDPILYQVEVDADGVSRTYVAEPADITPATLTGPVVAGKWRAYALTIPVQPNPTITGV